MSEIRAILLRRVPFADSHDLDKLSEIWDEVVEAIIQKMLGYSSQYMGDIHIDLCAEMTFELAKLGICIAENVVDVRLSSLSLNQIDEQLERESCFNEVGLEKINKTAIIYAQGVWLKLYNERWKPKTEAAIRKKAAPKITKLAQQRVVDNHFVPKSFIKRYWSEKDFIYRFTKNPNGNFTRSRRTFGQWGFVKNLYSDRLEAYFGLLENDAVRPLEMLLSVEPFNRPQREALVGFIVIQKLRNPHFMASLNHKMKPIVAEAVGNGREIDADYMRTVYETLYKNADFYDQLARPIYCNQWAMLKSSDAEFVLPDTFNIFGMCNGEQYVVMPITPKDCLIILPFVAPEISIVPRYINADSSLCRDISSILIANASYEFLAAESFQYSSSTSAETHKIMRQIILSIAKITSNK